MKIYRKNDSYLFFVCKHGCNNIGFEVVDTNEIFVHSQVVGCADKNCRENRLTKKNIKTLINWLNKGV
jgi:hypothetical protein